MRRGVICREVNCMETEENRIYKEQFLNEQFHGEQLHNELFCREQKKLLRARMKRLRASSSKEDREFWDQDILRRFLALPLVQQTDIFYCYISYGTEVDTHKLISALLSMKKRVACPRMGDGGVDMDFYEIRSFSDTAAGYRGIPEPSLECRRIQCKNAVVVTPGLAFTENGDRIGYGGGCYDRFFANNPRYPAIGLAYPFQVVPRIPMGQYDCRVDLVVAPGF